MRPLPHKSFSGDTPHPRHAAKAEKPSGTILETQQLIQLGRKTRHHDLLTLADPPRRGLIQRH
jgi:dihydrodipicolinate reductase